MSERMRKWNPGEEDSEIEFKALRTRILHAEEKKWLLLVGPRYCRWVQKPLRAEAVQSRAREGEARQGQTTGDPSFVSLHPHYSFSRLSPFLHSSEFQPPDSPMASMDDTMQRFRLGAIIRDFEILTSDIPGEKGFVFLEDVQYAFDTEVARFQAGTIAIPFMRGPDHRK